MINYNLYTRKSNEYYRSDCLIYMKILSHQHMSALQSIVPSGSTMITNSIMTKKDLHYK